MDVNELVRCAGFSAKSISTTFGKHRYASSALVCLSATFILGTTPCLAADSYTKGSDAKPSGTTLKGGVVEVSTALNDLRDARLSISRVRKAAANLYDEVTRQDVSVSYNPNLVGTMVIMTASPSFSGRTLPARSKWVNASMAEIGPIINLFKEDVDVAVESNRRAEVSDAAREQLEPLRAGAFETIKSSFGVYKHLEDLTSTGNYDNEAIASDAKTLDHQMKQLDKSLKKGISILQKESKASKKPKVAMRI